MTKRKTDFLWKHRNGKLTKKAKEYLSKIAIERYAKKKTEKRERIIKAQEEKIFNKKYVYAVKLKYNSENDTSKNVMVETTITIIAPEEPNEEHLKDLIFYEFTNKDENNFLANIPFDEVEVGLISVGTTTDLEKEEVKQIKYSHDLN